MKCRILNDTTSLEARISTFISDKGTDMVTGTRRMGRDPLVDLVIEIASYQGLKCFPSEDAPDDAEIVVFRHWNDMDQESVKKWPNADILFGQDLCHQVPAVVRWK